jgi:hypothetical protein
MKLSSSQIAIFPQRIDIVLLFCITYFEYNLVIRVPLNLIGFEKNVREGRVGEAHVICAKLLHRAHQIKDFMNRGEDICTIKEVCIQNCT